MKIFDRRIVAALLLCACALTSCVAKRGVTVSRPGEISPGAPAPVIEAPGAPAETLYVEPEFQPLAEIGTAPIVRVLVCQSKQPIRVRIQGSFRAGAAVEDMPLSSPQPGGDFTIRASGGEAVLSEGRRRLISAHAVLVRPDGGAFVTVAGKPYRGAMLFRAAGGLVMAINVLDIDEYIKGVLPSEIGYLKANQVEAYRAQAIAARSYALDKLEEKRGELYDLNATIFDQVYAGAGAEHEWASQAVDDTRGLVCTYLGEPIKAFYCSCCGGHTGDIRTVWPWKTPYPYLCGVRDTAPGSYGESVCRGSKNFRWRVHWSGNALGGIVRRTVPRELRVPSRNVGRLCDLRVTGIAQDGRVIGLEIETTRGSFEVLGDRIRWVLKPDPESDAILKSTLFRIDVTTSGGRISAVDMLGGGNGHGIGMCQTGAIRLAELGYSGEQILAHYYPGAAVELVYR